MSQGVRGRDAFPGVEDEHLFEEVDGQWLSIAELLGEGCALALGEGLDEAEGLAVWLAYHSSRQREEEEDERSRCKSSESHHPAASPATP